jgi:hypothetical protein
MNRLRAYNKYLVSKNKEPMTMIQLFKKDRGYSCATNGTNDRFNLFMKYKDKKIMSDPVLYNILKASIDAISDSGIDYSNDAFWLDGEDIFFKYNRHPKVKVGIKFSDPSHNIYNIKETPDELIEYYYHEKINKKTKDKRENYSKKRKRKI